ncbi:TonB-dependent receptor [Bacteroides sp. 519]|uniref:SusC/RagA family TonB-linked outer membrane protein n=1 Tax=Bacteroides sp. 519 TaxID=2302937 RepID=UPI0013CF716F|nr:TonB-dependent receptor [Bacteroides sp. 519]NDV57117.1 TonB-dependent receptor [Bacteroides sp. 519]
MENGKKQILKIPYLLLLMLFCCQAAFAQKGIIVKGLVVDGNGESIIGASIVVKGNTSMGTISDFDGKFELAIPTEEAMLVVSYIGMVPQEIKANSESLIKVVLKDDSQQLEEVVVVGYGQQKKASVVGAITQTTGKVLERAAGITDIGAALTGNLPGVITTQSSGMPGEEEPQIVIRGSSSWNGSDPLVLVDGIERPMSSVDMASVQSLSVLKDASATAVYGVKGANGVILITTKRGAEGKAQINVSANAIMKVPSKLPNKLDSYDAYMARNMAIEHELSLNPNSWDYIRSQGFIENFRNQTTLEQRERYPNVDWQKELFKDYTMSYNANVNVNGGTKFVKYFASMDYVKEGDLFRIFDNGRDYNSGYGYNRVNVRSNLDFQITKTTVFKVSLSGSNGQQKTPYLNSTYNSSSDWGVAQQWAGAYNIAPDVFLPQYSDGSWGYLPGSTNVTNSAQNVSIGGTMKSTTTRVTTDFVLEQDLSFITKGLNLRGMIAWDNTFVEWKRGINDLYNDPQLKWIDPITGEVSYKQAYEANNRFDFMQGVMWNVEGGEVKDWVTQRNLNYQMQLNWARTFGKHNVTGMGLFSRQETAIGSMVPNYREDWAFRTTYNFSDKYFIEYNGAYNGSEKFNSENRFAFFNSGAVGWMVSEESFMKFLTEPRILDMLKLRASYGEIGDDNVSTRWLYMNQWAYGGKSALDVNNGESPYTWYREASVGNKDVHWEKVKKFNFGLDYSFLDGLLAGSIEIFRDKRTDILVGGSNRSVPSYFGQAAVTANLGKVNTRGYELELRFNKTFNNEMRVWANFNMTHAQNEILVKDDAPLLPGYRKEAGYSIGQNHSYIDKGFLGSYDEIYGSPKHDSNDNQKLPGDYYIVDFNGDGVVDANDSAPYGYSSTPQNTYNATLGYEWKGFSCFVQFYGVNNVTREVTLTSFGNQLNTVYDMGSWWSKAGNSADVITPRWLSTPNGTYSRGTQYLFDGSFIRLKNVEVAYTFNNAFTKRMGISNLKLFVSGNNLWVWSRMPDDRESNFAGAGGQGAYPTMKRVNFGIKFTL